MIVIETTPLLSSNDQINNEERIQIEEETEEEDKNYYYDEEFKLVLKKSIMISISYILQNSLQTCSIILSGTLIEQRDGLSITAISYMWAMVTAGCLAIGGTTALDTLASTSFTSSSNLNDIGILLQRCIIILFLLYLPMTLIFWFMNPILLFLGQDSNISIKSQSFLRILSFGLPGYIFFEAVKKYLQVQGIMYGSTIVLIIMTPINIFLNWFFISKLDYGEVGAAIGTGISYWLAFFMICGYVRFVDGKQAWGGISRKSLENLPIMIKLSLSGFFMVGTEWWAFEIVALAAGRISVLALNAQSVIMTLDQVMTTLPCGIGVAASNRTGSCLGMGNGRRAQRSARASVLVSTLVGGMVTLMLSITRKRLGSLFSDDEEAIRAVAEVLPFVAAFQITDGWAQACGGVLRGVGKQHLGAIVNVTAYYFIALPLGIYLAFYTSMGLSGLWLGQCMALFLVGIIEFIILESLNWRIEVEKALERIEVNQQITL